MEAKQIIEQENIKIISFDLFDTLLVRPCISGKDLLKIFSETVTKEYNIEVKDLRISAIESLGNSCASIQDIWRYIAEQQEFPYELADTIAEKEFEFEQRFLFPRRIAKDIFNFAVSKGKKIIIVSDMYYSSEQLKLLLEINGYSGVSNVYVSCEHKATKRTGTLFDIVVLNENIQNPTEILHIGDSRKSDVLAPQSKGINVIHIPRNTSIFKEYFSAQALLENFKNSTYENVIYGFSINHLMNNIESYSNKLPLFAYVHLVVFPMLFHVAFFLLTEPKIQRNNKYQKLFFASRDGYLTKKAYDVLSAYIDESLDSGYVFISRITSATITEKSFFDRMEAPFIPEKCTLKEFLVPTVTNLPLRNKILSGLSNEELSLLIHRDRDICIKLLSNYKDALEQHHQEKKNAASLYYTKAFSNATSIILADCGFSGTISNYMSKGFDGSIIFDKAYFWENDKNKHLDQINGSKTYTAFSHKKGHAIGPMVESLFSELSGSCIGFNCENGKDIEPIFEDMWQPEEMKADITFIHNLSIELVKEFCAIYGPYFSSIINSSFQVVMDFIMLFFEEDNINMLSMFNNIKFKETYLHDICPESLGDMMLKRNARGVDKING